MHKQQHQRRTTMNSILFLVGSGVVSQSGAFQLPSSTTVMRPSSSSSSSSSTQLFLGPEILGPMSDMLHSTAQHYHSFIDPVASATAGVDHIDAILSSSVTTSNAAAAHGNSWFGFGQVDPYLSAGKSVAPPDKNLLDMGITPTFHAKSASAVLPADVAADFKGAVQKAIDNGATVLDTSKIQNGGATHMPGFQETRGILPAHNNDLLRAQADPDVFKYQIGWASQFLKAFDKLPYVAFFYALFEFGFLRNDVDLYKEDIEDDPSGVMAESIVVIGVRLVAFILIGFLTVTMFG